jgi:kynurenine formamidase
MCVPGCLVHIGQSLNRRRFIGGTGATLAATAAMAAPRPARAASPRSFTRAVDLTHPLASDFPTYFGEPQLEIEVLNSYEEDKFNMKAWRIVEHTGTHLDAPFHFSADGRSADEIEIDKLVLPVAVIDIAGKAQDDADAQLTPDDIRAFEAEHGPLPGGCCVAMHSGWGRFVRDAKFRNADHDGTMHFPGFHLEAAQMLIEERDVLGIAVDTLSLDFGRSPDFAVHYAWLPTDRWGLEGVANLDRLPPTGATLVVGGPKIEGATGGPTRVIGLV